MNPRMCRILGLLAVLGLLSAGCGGDDASAVDRGGITTIELVANPWNGSALNSEVAKQILESELGYSVNITDIDENDQWAAINSGEKHASLEVWPSGHADNTDRFIYNPDGNVVDAGLLGPVGKIGWWVPGYMIDEYPELATWEGLADTELAKVFATAETSDNRGQILHGHPSWVSYEQNIIDNLGLHIELVYAESEENLVAAFKNAFALEMPMLGYFWTPHSLHGLLDLRQVELPGYTDECYGRESKEVDCGYPADNLFKIVWGGLELGAPAAWQFLRNFNYTTEDQVSMLTAVEIDGLSVEEAAAAWIEDNDDVWRTWLP